MIPINICHTNTESISLLARKAGGSTKAMQVDGKASPRAVKCNLRAVE